MILTASETAPRGTFEAIFAALDRSTAAAVGPATPRLLVIPLRDQAKAVVGGLWGVTLFRWLQIEMLFVPETMRGRGVGSALMAVAEAEARIRLCLGINLDTLSFQAAGFYEKLGFRRFGSLDDCPPGHQRLFLQKRLA